MKTVIYIDVLLLVNFLIALFLLLVAGMFTNQNAPFWRMIIGSTLASLATFILFAPHMPFILQVLYQFTTAFFVVLVSYPSKTKRQYIKLIVWYFSLNLLLAGVVILFSVKNEERLRYIQSNNLSVYFYVSPVLLISCVCAVYITLKILTHCFGTPLNVPLQDLMIEIANEKFCLRAFYDTGFSVHDPFSNRRVVLVSLPAIVEQLSFTFAQELYKMQQLGLHPESSAQLCTPRIIHQFRYLHCNTVVGAQLLPAVCVNTAYLKNKPTQKIEQLLVVFCDTPMFCDDSNALFGVDLASDFL